MKIAQVVCVFPPYKGGMGNSVYQFARVLSKQGHEVTVFTPDYSSGAKQKEVKDGFEIIRLKPWIKYGNAAFLPQLLWKLGGFQPKPRANPRSKSRVSFDIVHLHYPFFGAAEIIALRKILFGEKMNLVVHYHMDSISRGIKGFIFKLYQLFILPILLRQAKIITCASLDYVKHSVLAGYYKKHQEKFRKTFFGVNLEQFVIYHDHKNKERKNKIVLFVGGLDKAHYFKGLENLLKAIKIVRQDLRDDILLNIVGEGELKPYYKNLAKQLKVGEYVYFAENADNNKLVDYYNYCDVVVLPSVNQGEAFGLVLLEAMACAKPIITSNLPGVRSVFKNGKHGLLVQPDNVDDLVNKLKAILSDKNLARKMGQAGRELVEKKYTWEKVGKRLNLIYYYVKYTPK